MFIKYLEMILHVEIPIINTSNVVFKNSLVCHNFRDIVYLNQLYGEHHAIYCVQNVKVVSVSSYSRTLSCY